MNLSLAEKFILLALKDESGAWVTGDTEILYALPGCIIIELTQNEYLRIENKKLVISKEELTGDPILDKALTLIKESPKLKSPKVWVEKLSGKMKGLKDEYLSRLQEKGILRLEKGKVLWIFDTKKYPTNNPMPELKLRQKIRDVVIAGSSPDPEMAALLSLVHATDLVNEIFEKDERKNARKRIKEIFKETKVGNPVAEMIEEIQVALTVVLMAAVVTTTVSS